MTAARRIPAQTPLAETWAHIRQRCAELPDVPIFVWSCDHDDTFGAAWNAGDDTWDCNDLITFDQITVGVTSWGLARPAADVLETLLHEAAHVLGYVRGEELGVEDHGPLFGQRAISLGLGLRDHPSRPGWYGTDGTYLTSETAADYGGVIGWLDRQLPAFLEARYREWLEAHVGEYGITADSLAARS